MIFCKSMDKFFLDKNEAVLAVVDIQEKLASVMKDIQKVISNAVHLIEASKILNIPILLTEQYPKGLGTTVEEIKKALPYYKPIEKLFFSCCRETAFLNELSLLKKKKIIITGIETHVCVLQTCLDLINNGYVVHIVKDAVCSRTAENHETALNLMRDMGSVVSCTETVLFQLLQKAGSEEFKTISKRIK